MTFPAQCGLAVSPRKLLSSAATHHFMGPCHPPPPPLYYISAYGLDKSYLKWQKIHVAMTYMHCGVGSLIAIKQLAIDS